MRLVGRLRAHLVRSPVYLLLSTGQHPSASSSVDSKSHAVTAAGLTKSQLRGRSGGVRRLLGPGVGVGDSGETPRDVRTWLQLLRRRISLACRPKNIAKISAAVFVAMLLVIIVTKGYSSRRRNVCKCAKFTYSQCQPYEGECGQGIKKAFCQQKKCQPRRKIVRCSVPCDATTAGSLQNLAGCVYVVRRQSVWTQCSAGMKHRSRLLFLQPHSPAHCPATRTERRPCHTAPDHPIEKNCHYEPRGTWSICNRQRNEIVNIRKLVNSGVSDCPMELRSAARCVKRDGTLKCIHSHWTKWSHCTGGKRHKTRALIQGSGCGEVTRLEQNCPKLPTPQKGGRQDEEVVDAIIRE